MSIQDDIEDARKIALSVSVVRRLEIVDPGRTRDIMLRLANEVEALQARIVELEQESDEAGRGWLESVEANRLLLAEMERSYDQVLARWTLATDQRDAAYCRIADLEAQLAGRAVVVVKIKEGGADGREAPQS